MKNRYQLIKPFSGSKVHQTSSLKKGAKKCYDELKTTPHYYSANSFTVIDLDSYKTYDFLIHHNNKIGGNPFGLNNIEEQKDNIPEQTNQQDVGQSIQIDVDNKKNEEPLIQQSLNQEKESIAINKEIISKLTDVENKLDMVLQFINEKNKEIEKKKSCDDGCVIM